MKDLTIVFTTNSSFLNATLTTLLSLFWNNSRVKFKTYILSIERISNFNKFRFKILCLFFRNSVNFILLSGMNMMNYEIRSKRIENHSSSHLKFEAFLRLYIPYLLNDSKIIYFDSDLLIRKNIIEFLNFEIQNDNILGAVKELLPTHLVNKMEKLGISPSDYVNSGVLIINRNNWLKKFPHVEIVDELIQNWEVDLHPAHDQDLINDYFRKKIVFLPQKYNTMSVCLHKEKSPSIIHFTGGGKFKPWHYKCRNKYVGLYWKYRFFVEPLGCCKFYVMRLKYKLIT